jgi:hypothetical protein
VRDLLESARTKLEAKRAQRTALRPERRRDITEAMVQQAAFDAIARAEEPFHGRKPVLMFNVPFQFPMPLSGSETQEVVVSQGNALGHADILVRRRPSTLAVLELKKPGGTARTALSQAVAYAAALEVLMEQDRETTLWALGYKPKRTAPIQLEAWAVVDAMDEAAVRANAAELQAKNRHYPLRAWLYDFSDGMFRIVNRLDDLGDPTPTSA